MASGEAQAAAADVIDAVVDRVHALAAPSATSPILSQQAHLPVTNGHPNAARLDRAVDADTAMAHTLSLLQKDGQHGAEGAPTPGAHDSAPLGQAPATDDAAAARAVAPATPAADAVQRPDDAAVEEDEGAIPSRFLAAIQGVHVALEERDVRRVVAHLHDARTQLVRVSADARAACGEVFAVCASKASARIVELAQGALDGFHQALAEGNLVGANVELSRTNAHVRALGASGDDLGGGDGAPSSGGEGGGRGVARASEERAAAAEGQRARVQLLREMADSAEERLRAALSAQLRRAAAAGERQMLRTLLCELCLLPGREAQARLCVSLYTEAVIKTLHISALSSAQSAEAAASISALADSGADGAPSGGGGARSSAVKAAKSHSARMCALVELIASLHAEVAGEYLPRELFVRPVVSELHADGCNQLLEMLGALESDAELEQLASQAEAQAAAEEEEEEARRAGGGEAGEGGGGAERADAAGAVLALDLVLQEVASVLQLCAVFFDWLRDAAGEVDSSPQLTRAPPPGGGGAGGGGGAAAGQMRGKAPGAGGAAAKLRAASQALACKYMQAELAYSRVTAQRAIRLAEVADGVSSLVEDTFFVVLKCFQRASSCRETMLVVLPLLATLTQTILVRQLAPEVVELLQRASPVAADADADAGVVAINSAQCAVEYSAQLADAVRTVAAQMFGEHAPLADPAVDELGAFAEAIAEHVRAAVAELAESLMPTAWLLLEWQVASYEVTPSRRRQRAGEGGRAGADDRRASGGGASLGASDADGRGGADERALADDDADGAAPDDAELPAAQMVAPLVRKLEELRGRLVPAAHAATVEELARQLAARMEEGILAKRFNELGAIQLGAEIRLISESLSAATDGSVRHCFSRLTQIAFLLNAASVGEATTLMAEACATAADDDAPARRSAAGSAGSQARLTAAEACRVVSLRVEFAGVDFAAIL